MLNRRGIDPFHVRKMDDVEGEWFEEIKSMNLHLVRISRSWAASWWSPRQLVDR